MSDMREDMLQSLAKQRATKQERSQALENEHRRARLRDATRRADMGQLCEWAIKARHEVPLINGEYEFIAAYTPEIADTPEHK